MLLRQRKVRIVDCVEWPTVNHACSYLIISVLCLTFCMCYSFQEYEEMLEQQKKVRITEVLYSPSPLHPFSFLPSPSLPLPFSFLSPSLSPPSPFSPPLSLSLSPSIFEVYLMMYSSSFRNTTAKQWNWKSCKIRKRSDSH